jgi:Prophage CP4-57 regulatory protein (AlpA)
MHFWLSIGANRRRTNIVTTTITKQFGRSRDTRDAHRGRRYLSPKDLAEKGIRYHINHLRRMWQQGLFPPPTYLSPRKLAWAEDVVDEWIASKSEEA